MQYDIPSDDKLHPDIHYNYDIITKQRPIENVDTPREITGQFISLRDTFIDSDKKYPGKRGATLIVGDTERSVEIKYKNRFKVSFEPPNTQSPGTISIDEEGPYVESDNTYGQLGAIIKEDGRYRVVFKTQVLTQPNTKQVYAYCDYYPINDDGTYPSQGIPIAVYDVIGEFSKQYTGSISGSCPEGHVSGSCSVTVSFKLGDIIQSITTFGYNERDCRRGDKMCFKAVDENNNPLTLQPYSNFFSIEYLDFNKDKDE